MRTRIIPPMRTESLAFLRKLLDTPSPSGFEREGQRVWLDYVRANGATRTWNDAYGNCFAELSPTPTVSPRDKDTLFGGNGFVEGVNSGVVQSSIGANRLGEVG